MPYSGSVKPTAIIHGELTASDLEQEYKSEATTTFKPFIVNPNNNLTNTTHRDLFGR